MKRFTTVSLAATLGALLLAPPGVLAQDVACEAGEGFPCGYQLSQQVLKPAPTLLKVQARVAQAGMPIAKAKFQKVLARVMRGGEQLCLESFTDVIIEGSVVNLELGQEMSCELGEVLADNSDLALQLCIGSIQTCMPPIPLMSSPYAVRSTWAWHARRAHRVERAAQAHYTHRFTADRDLDEREVLGTGYLDTETPDAAAAAPLYDAETFEPYEDGGYLLWTPIRNRSARTLHVSGQRHGDGFLKTLDEVAAHATRTTTRGRLEVEPRTPAGLGVEAGGAHIQGTTTFESDLSISGPVTLDGSWEQDESVDLASSLTVGAGLDVPVADLDIAGQTTIDGGLGIAGATSLEGGLDVAGNSSVSGLLDVEATEADTVALTVTGDLDGSGISWCDGAHVLGTAAITTSLGAGRLEVAGSVGAADLTVAGDATMHGDIIFEGHVTFFGGTSKPGAPPDAAYVQYEDEDRDLDFAGSLTFAEGATAETYWLGGYHRLQQARFQLASAPPSPCEEGTEGLVYLDMTEHTIRLCTGGVWKTLGGGGGAFLCGNGFLQQGEGCDDGNLEPGDGCAADCSVELGWACDPSGCATACGDGIVMPGEGCDDGGVDPADGCSDSCEVELGWACEGEPSACQIPCGDGLIFAAEVCDDGNPEAGDGCAADCTVETGWYCDEAEPTLCLPIPLSVPGYAGVAGPDLHLDSLSLCAGGGAGDEAVEGKDWFALCEDYGEIVFACSTGDDTTPEYQSPALEVTPAMSLVDDECDDWVGAASSPWQGDLVLSVDASDPDCNDFDNSYEMYMHFGVQWTCLGEDITPGFLGQVGGRTWAYVRFP